MVSNSFLCHFPSHYLLRMNSRINYLQSMTRMLISSSHWCLVLLNMWTWLSHFWHFHFVIKNTCLREPDKLRDALQANKKWCLQFPELWIFFYSLRRVATACSERAGEGICWSDSCGFIKLHLRFSYFSPSPTEDTDDTKNDCLSAQILRIFCCTQNPIPFWGWGLFVVPVFLSNKS